MERVTISEQYYYASMSKEVVQPCKKNNAFVIGATIYITTLVLIALVIGFGVK